MQEQDRAGQGSNEQHCTGHPLPAGTARSQFTFYRSFYDAVCDLKAEDRLAVYELIIAYALDKKEPGKLKGVQKTAFILVKPVLDAAWEKARAGIKSGKSRRTKCEQSTNKGEIEKEKEYEKELEIENEIENETEDDSLYPAGFLEFWDLYPVKLGKDAALRAWKQCRPDPKEVCDGVKQWLQTRQWTKEQGQFIPRAAKFIEERHDRHLPGDHIPNGATGVLGKAELEAIEMVMREK